MAPFEPEWQHGYGCCDRCGDDSLTGYTITIMCGGYISDQIRIGPHLFEFRGDDESYARWRRHMERCKRDYETRLATRKGNT